MALTTYTIAEDLLDALGQPFGEGRGTVTFRPKATKDARVDGGDVLLGAISYDLNNVPKPVTLTAGAWDITIESRSKINGAPEFKTLRPSFLLDADTTWGAIVAGEVTPVPLETPTNAIVATYVTTPGDPVREAIETEFGPSAQVASGVVDRRRDLSLTQQARFDPRPVTVTYRPASLVQVTSTITTFADVDATNLKVTVVCPPSGKIRYRLRACSATGGANTQGRWGLAVNGQPITATIGVSIQATTAAAAPATPVSIEGVLSTIDNAGTPMVPGKAYTITWQHASGTAGSSMRTEYGGTVGSAVMEFTPVVVRATESRYTATESALGGTVPLWLCHDRKTFLGTASSPWRVQWSTDAGATWATHPGPSLPQVIQLVRETDDGEILAFVANQGATASTTIWKSSGWAANHSTATFAKVLETTGPSSGGAWRDFGVDTHGPLVFAAEYGPTGSGTDASNMARYVHMSEDYGQTWRVVFDLAEYEINSAHTHGVAYDPWWDAIWVSTGDDEAGIKGDVSGNFVSFDRGATWTRLTGFAHQTTSIAVLPSCVLFTTDDGGPNGIYRIPRTTRTALQVEMAHLFDAGEPLTHYGTSVFQLRSAPGAPLLFATQTADVAGSARLVATYDGYTFKETWVDSSSYANRGLYNVAGPTDSGVILAHLNRGTTAGTPLTEAQRLTLTPA